MPIKYVEIECKCGSSYKADIALLGTAPMTCYTCGNKFDEAKYKGIRASICEIQAKLSEVEAAGGYVGTDKIKFFED